MEKFEGYFPRIPLFLKVPETMPEIRKIISFSVDPRMSKNIVAGRELEIEGEYVMVLKYYGIKGEAQDRQRAQNFDKPGCFFQDLTVMSGGMLGEVGEIGETAEGMEGVFSWCWKEPIHTFIELTKPRYQRRNLSLKVHQCNVALYKTRILRGYLVLKLSS